MQLKVAIWKCYSGQEGKDANGMLILAQWQPDMAIWMCYSGQYWTAVTVMLMGLHESQKAVVTIAFYDGWKNMPGSESETHEKYTASLFLLELAT